MPRPIHSKIFTSSIEHNIKRAQEASGAKVWATIKANAYGHGIERIYPALAQADGLAMLDFDEAKRVRNLGWQKPILMLEGCFEVADYRLVADLSLTPVIHNQGQIDWLAQAALTESIDVYLKMNTGMNRVGYAPEVYQTAYERLSEMPCIRSITLMTHFANADLADGVEQPMRVFNNYTQSILEAAPQTQRSCSNSAAILAHPETHFDWVRPGIMTYGGSPFADRTAQALDLKPAMSLESEIIAIQTVQKGEAIGYGSRFVAPHEMRIGVVACGYADGYPRHAPDGTPVWVNGVRTTLIGRVSMDMLMVDLNIVPDAKVGSPVELWGKNIPIDEVAQASGTIGYELMCALAIRVPVSIVS